MAAPSEARKGEGWSTLVDGFRTCEDRRLLILEMDMKRRIMQHVGYSIIKFPGEKAL